MAPQGQYMRTKLLQIIVVDDMHLVIGTAPHKLVPRWVQRSTVGRRCQWTILDDLQPKSRKRASVSRGTSAPVLNPSRGHVRVAAEESHTGSTGDGHHGAPSGSKLDAGHDIAHGCRPHHRIRAQVPQAKQLIAPAGQDCIFTAPNNVADLPNMSQQLCGRCVRGFQVVDGQICIVAPSRQPPRVLERRVSVWVG